MKYTVEEIIIENKANEESTDKWTAKPDEKLEKIEQSIADVEETVKNCERRKSCEKKNQEEDSREEFEKKKKPDRYDTTRASKIKQNKRGR